MPTTYGTTTIDAAWHHYAYRRTGQLHEVLLDGVVQVSVSNFDLSAVSPTAMVAFMDVFPGGTVSWALASSVGTTGTTLVAKKVIYATSITTWVVVGSRSGAVPTATGLVWTSQDGQTWTLRTAAQGYTWTSVAFSPTLGSGSGRLVAVTSTTLTGGGANVTDQVMYSDDKGVTWTSATSIERHAWQDVVWADALSLFVAVANSDTTGNTNRVMTSTDGITWTAHAAAAALTWSGIAWDGTTLVATAGTAGTGSVMTSTTGTTWTQQTTTQTIGFRNRGIFHSTTPSMFVAVGTVSGVVHVLRSTNSGVTWSDWAGTPTGVSTSDGSQLSGVANLLMLSAGNAVAYVMTSPDGITWTKTTMSDVALDNFLRIWDPIASDGTKFALMDQGAHDTIALGTFTTAAQGKLTGVKIWNAALSNAEVSAEMADYPAVRTNNLYAETHLAVITDLTDSSGNGNSWAIDPVLTGTLENIADGPNVSGHMTTSISSKLANNVNVALSILKNPPTNFGRQVTFMGWWRFPAVLPATGRMMRLANDDNVGNTPEVSWAVSTTNKVGLTLINGAVNPVTIAVAATPSVPVGPIPSTVSLAATVTHDSTYAVGTYAWTLTSGPAGGTPTISTPTAATTNVVFNADVPGVYTFQVLVTGTNTFDGSAAGPIAATINLTIAPPTAPTVSSGSQQVTYPAGTTLTPTVVDDGWSGAVTYAWTQLAGPGTATIATPAAASTAVTFPNALGTYVFQLVASNSAFSGYGFWRVTVFNGTSFALSEDAADTIVTVNGTAVDALVQTPTITEQNGSTPNSCSIKVLNIVVPEGAEIIISHGLAGRIFGGTASKITQQQFESNVGAQFSDVQVTGFEWTMARRAISKVYRNTSISAIAADLVSHVPGFTSTAVQAGLPVLTEFRASGQVTDALNALVQTLDGSAWHVDYFKDVYFGIVDASSAAPIPITALHPDLREFSSYRDISQTITQLVVTGQSPGNTITEQNSTYVDKVAVPSLDNYSAGGGTAVLNGQTFTYSGTSTAMVGSVFGLVQPQAGFSFQPTTDPSGLLLPSRGYYYLLVLVTANGKTPAVSSWSSVFLSSTQNAFKLRFSGQLLGANADVAHVTGIEVYRNCLTDSSQRYITTFPPGGGVYTDVTADANELEFHAKIPTVDTTGVLTYYLTGVSGLTQSTQTIAPVQYSFTVNDASAQAILAAKFGGTDDGVISRPFDAGTVSLVQAQLNAKAFLSQRSSIDVGVSYLTKDWNARPPRSLTVALPDARNVIDDFKIQRTVISNFESGLSPLYRVTATKKIPLKQFEALLKVRITTGAVVL